MKIIYPINFHLDRREPCPVLDAVQGENGRAVAVSLFEKGQPWNIPAGAYALIRYARPDACGGIYDTLPGGAPACGIQGNTVTAQLTAQALAVAGMVSVQLAIVYEEVQLATFIFLVRVESDPSAGTAAAEEYVNLLPQLIQDAKNTADAAEQAALSAKQAAASLDASFELVGQAQTQSYIAQQKATLAAQSAATAESAAKRAEDAAASVGGGTASGKDGEDGGYYTPHVEHLTDGTMRISFIGSKQDMPQVPISNITLPAGKDGADGQPGEKGDKGDTGAQGEPGKDGVSATHSWNGTTLTITSASGTSSADLKGEKGDKGDAGADGKDGTSVTVKSVSESTADGGSNVVTFSDGKTVTIKNGAKGSTGSKGDKGDKGDTGATGPAYTLTAADKSSIASAVKASLATESWTFTLEDGSTVTKAVYMG